MLPQAESSRAIRCASSQEPEAPTSGQRSSNRFTVAVRVWKPLSLGRKWGPLASNVLFVSVNVPSGYAEAAYCVRGFQPVHNLRRVELLMRNEQKHVDGNGLGSADEKVVNSFPC